MSEIIDNPDNSTELIEVQIHAPSYKMNDTFRQLSDQIPVVVEKAHSLLDNIDVNDLENVDEDELALIIKQMKDVKPFHKQIKEARQAVKRHLNQATDEQLQMLDDMLTQMGFDELDGLILKSNEILRLQKEERRNRRWQELEQKFNETVDQYPLLRQYIPYSVNFEKFKNANPKIVSAAKNANVSSAMLDTVAAYIGNMQSDVQSILEMESPFQDRLFQQYQLAPNLPQIIQYNRDLEKQQKKEQELAEAKRQAEIQREAERQARIIYQKKEAERRAKEQEAIKKAQEEAAKNNKAGKPTEKVIIKTVTVSGGSQPKISKASRKDAGSPFTETLESYLLKRFPKITNNAEKFDALFTLFREIGSQNPDIMRFIKNPDFGMDAVHLIDARDDSKKSL